MRLLLDPLIAGFLIEVARGIENTVGPQLNFSVTSRAREESALLHKPPADAEASRPGFNEQQAQLGYGFR